MSIGEQVAENIYQEIKNTNKSITLAIIQVGDDKASNIYINMKRKKCKELGWQFVLKKYSNTIITSELISEINKVNMDDNINGCIVQLPLPQHIDQIKILDSVDANKDVDCFSSANIAKLYYGNNNVKYMPATVYGVYRMIKYYNIQTKGKICVIIGKSNIVGKPMQLVMSDENDLACTTILCDKYTENLAEVVKNADIMIVAAGKHHLISNPEWIKDGCVIIDVGIHKIQKKEKYVLEGDVDYDSVKHKCSLITPVPKGVGPITVAGLMFNLYKSVYI